MSWRCILPAARSALIRVCALAALGGPATADGGAEAAIRDALAKWTSDFNAGATDRICDLFAKDLRYNYRGFPERGYADICSTLQRSLNRPGERFSYALEIDEVLVSGDLAIVRLLWTLTTLRASGQQEVSRERGLDVFRKQPDGRWRIIRYVAYEE